MSGQRLYLLRHGETAWNRDGNRYCGRTDIPLNDTGREQAALAARALARVPFTAVYCSPLQRSRVTAEMVAGERRLPVVVDDRLIEIDFGAWEGRIREEFIAADPDSWVAWQSDPCASRAGGTGETGLEVVERMSAFATDALRTDGPVLAIGHNTVNRLFLAGILGMPLRNYRLIHQGNAGINVLERSGGVWSCLRVNQSAAGAI